MVTKALFQFTNAGTVLFQLASHAEKRQQPVGHRLPHALRPSQDAFDCSQDVGGLVAATVVA
jgi:hypothetical protein